MGMSRMFTNGAEFSELLEQNEPLKVSKVVHKAFIEVNEEGAEAAAATGRTWRTLLFAFCIDFMLSVFSLLLYVSSQSKFMFDHKTHTRKFSTDSDENSKAFSADASRLHS
jgi:serine protease inhibitor